MKRYKMSIEWDCMVEAQDGSFVTFADASAKLQSQASRIAELEAELKLADEIKAKDIKTLTNKILGIEKERDEFRKALESIRDNYDCECVVGTRTVGAVHCVSCKAKETLARMKIG